MPRFRSLPTTTATCLLGAAFAAGCTSARTLIVTPYVAAANGHSLYDKTPPEWRTPDFPVLYVTDRAPIEGSEEDVEFSYRRSKRLRFGEAVVRLSPVTTWAELVAASTNVNRSTSFQMEVAAIEPLGEISGRGKWLEAIDGRLQVSPENQPKIDAEVAEFQTAVRRWLDRSERKEAFIFIHGFNNTFDHSVFRAAEIWHFMGRVGVPIAYTWPAARGGIRGYTYDRESGEYTIPHLKQVIRALAAMPDLERINLISHSRGTDVTVTALRELYLETTGGGHDPAKTLKIGTLVLAAPDIDTEVFGQRFGAEMVTNAAERTVIYFSPDDEAIWWARWLFDSVGRLGDLIITKLPEDDRARLAQMPRLEMVDCTVSGFSTSHNYVFSHPSAMSDMILVVRDRCPPGCPERPLQASQGVWSIDNKYLVPVEKLDVTPPAGAGAP